MSDYKIAFYYSPDDNAYVTCVPELPGCMADGKTIAEAIDNTKRVIDEWIEVTNEAGEIVPKPLSDIEFTDATAIDVAHYILQKTDTITTWALEKLTYYCKVWSLVWYGKSIVSDTPQAWKDGPVFQELYSKHKKKYVISPQELTGNHVLSDSEKRLIENILDIYASFGAEELRDMTHRELPWNAARGDLPSDAISHNEITDSMILEYYKI